MRCVTFVILVLVGCGTEAAPPPSTAVTPTSAPPDSITPGESTARSCRDASPDERVALAAAEAFVRDNGYTDAPAPDGAEIVSEGMEPGDDRASILAARHASLESDAFGVFPHGDATSVTVIFRYQRAHLRSVFSETETDERLRTTARAVEITDGAPPQIVHQDAMLVHADPICPRAP